jgi:hypothetical protein
MPPQLQLSLLNVPPAMDAIAALPRPQHVILNHIYLQRMTTSTHAMVVGTTHRYRSKYVTTVMCVAVAVTVGRKQLQPLHSACSPARHDAVMLSCDAACQCPVDCDMICLSGGLAALLTHLPESEGISPP